MTNRPLESGRSSRFNRRQFLALTGLAMAGGVMAASSHIVLNNEANEPVVERVHIPLKGLSPALEGFTIAVLADFHLYPFIQLELI